MYPNKKLFQLIVLFYSVLSFAQTDKKDILQGDFTYLLKARLNTQTPDYIHQEFFSLQIGDKRAFFASSQSIKRDSTFEKSLIREDNRDGSISLSLKKGVSMPKTKFSYTIIQSTENTQYFELAGMAKLTYKEPVISNWKLMNETKVINTISCKKAEVNFKGRNWTAWYSTEIPFPYGPYKFSGLPGLIVKITDEKGDYNFELVKSVSNSELKGRSVNISERRYSEAIETTQPKLQQALKNAAANTAAILASQGTTVIGGQEIMREREKQREENRKYENPIEL
ncbi:GLPGLI family protein [Chryseobacterium vrystaatense]|uniref:GLPGLI family protein n=1 Tax=Chryseobacterium vrystaatense TaxID=307480 RepID=A0A1M5BUE3_9FLAO|nr:GLPGLI family protein [Chryseobacterium vrystaatense]SHF46036.1 GLPGLI family protein [Chryseobacterium vrystaatense]